MKKLLLAILSALLICCGAALIPTQQVFAATEAPTIVYTSDATDIKNNDIGKEINISVSISNPGQRPINASDITFSFKPAVYEYVSFDDSQKDSVLSMSGIDVMNSDTANGIVVVMFDVPNFQSTTAAQFKVGSFKLKVKAAPTQANEADITITGASINDDLGEPMADVKGTDTKLEINFSEPSSTKELTSLKVNGQAVTVSHSMTYNAPYSYTSFTGVTETHNGKSVSYSIAKGSPISYSNNKATVTITVTAEDNSTVQYTLTINRATAQQEKYLSTLKFLKGSTPLVDKSGADLDSGTDNYPFDAGTIAFADKDSLKVEFSLKGSLATAEVKLDGSNIGSASMSLGTVAAGSHTLEVISKSEAGTTATYTISFVVTAADTNSLLSSLSLKIIKAGGVEEPVNFSKDFSPETLNYSATVPEGTEKVKVYAEAASPLAQVTGTGEHGVPGSITVTVTPQGGSPVQYVISVAELKDTSGLGLQGVSVKGIKGGNVFDLSTRKVNEEYYYVTIPADAEIDHFKVVASSSDPSYTVEGINTEYSITLSNSEYNHYVRFIKNQVEEKSILFQLFFENNVRTLQTLTCGSQSITLVDGKSYYSTSVSAETESVVVSATAADSKAEVLISSAGDPDEYNEHTVTLEGGINVVVIKVTATNGTDIGVYTLSIIRPKRSLKTVVCGEQTITLGDNTKVYNVDVDPELTDIKVIANAIEGATASIEYEYITEEVSSSEKTVSLKAGNNYVLVKVTGDDGITDQYVLNLKRNVAEQPVADNTPYIIAISVLAVVFVIVVVVLTVLLIAARRRVE